MLPARVALLILLLAVAAPPLSAQQPNSSAAAQTQAATPAPDPSGPIFTLHSTARLVVLDVVVTDDKGQSLKNLKPSDFTLSEDGVEQHILSLTEHDASDAPSASGPEAALPPNTFATHPPISAETPKVVIVLDDLAFADAPFVRDEIRAFMKTLAAGTPISIFRIDWQGLHLVQSLTADPAVLQEAASSQRILPPLGFPVRYLHHTGSHTQQLASYLAAIPGRINLVWFGAGLPGGHDEGLFPNLAGGVPPDLAAFVARESAAPNVLRLSRIALYPIDTRGPGDVASCQALMEMANSTGGKAYCNTNGFKEALADVVSNGSHYYTLSYSPTNADWSGKYRRLKVEVGPDVPVTPWDKILAWINPLNGKVLYRDGYFARDRPSRANPVPDLNQRAANSPPTSAEDAPPATQQRRLISYSAKGDPNQMGRNTAMQAAMAFGMATPFQLPLRVTLTAAPETEKLHPGGQLPRDNFLTAAFRDEPFRTYRVHYSIEPKDLQFAQNAGEFLDSFAFAVVVYRDDGLTANSIAYTARVDADPDQYFRIMAKGLSYDQTIAIPATKDHFFLRAGVHELTSNRIGAIEVPSERIKVPVPDSHATVVAPSH